MKALVNSFQTVLLSTCDLAAEPTISYSPFTIVDGKLYVLLSDLALHTANLKSNPRASLLFIENETDAESLHARKRVTYQAESELIGRGSPTWKTVLASMQDRFGDIIPLLESLPDFHLFEMKTSCAVFVRGFADAHTVECQGFGGL